MRTGAGVVPVVLTGVTGVTGLVWNVIAGGRVE